MTEEQAEAIGAVDKQRKEKYRRLQAVLDELSTHERECPLCSRYRPQGPMCRTYVCLTNAVAQAS